jgi:hypothetical protein
LWYHVGNQVTGMSPKRAALYLGSATVLVAWFAFAGVVDRYPDTPSAAPAPVQTAGTETLAEEVQAQAGRLRERLAAAPAPTRSARNPFAFGPKPLPRVARPSAPVAAAAPIAPPIVPEPVLSLVGLAEDRAPDGLVRTAVISAEGGELFMVKLGETIGPRYRVQAIAADSVELADLITGAVRRLALK